MIFGAAEINGQLISVNCDWDCENCEWAHTRCSAPFISMTETSRSPSRERAIGMIKRWIKKG